MRITGFVPSMPNTGSPATGETVVRVLYDDENISADTVMCDEHPERTMELSWDGNTERSTRIPRRSSRPAAGPSIAASRRR